MTAERFDAFEQESEILRKIAKQYAPNSKEYLAIEHATFALAFAVTEVPEKLADLIRDCGSNLTDQQKARIKGLGLDWGLES